MYKFLMILSVISFFACPLSNDLTTSADKIDSVDTILTMDEYNNLSSIIDLPGIYNQKEVKFVITDADSEEPLLYFINSNKFQDHYNFLIKSLKLNLTIQEFKSKAYFTKKDRQIIVGELIYYNGYNNGTFAMEFWATDLLPYKTVNLAHTLITDKITIDKEVIYHPKGIIQENDTNSLDYVGAPFNTISTQKLFEQFSFIPFNKGESYGILRDSTTTEFNLKDVVLLRNIPNTLNHVSGIITELPQTPLSHINLIARQNSIPNSYIKNPFNNSDITDLVGKYVHYVVGDNSYTLEEASLEDVNNYFEEYRPKTTQIPVIDKEYSEILSLKDINFEDSNIYGSKASNVAELGRILPEGTTPVGYAVPFSYYINYMEDNGLTLQIDKMIKDPLFSSDIEYKKEALKAFRKEIKSGELPKDIIAKFETLIRDQYPEGTNLRCRSSTNNEDLEGFSGAGLYESYTHKQDEGTLDKSIKQVWASLWTLRAFQEREFYRVDHKLVAMAVLIHPNYKNEKSNGVAVTKNIFDSDYRGYYVNVQLGEDMVTNPEENSIPEELLITVDGFGSGYGTEYIRYSNLVKPGIFVISPSYIDQLTGYMATIHNHFVKKYSSTDTDFAMEIEFKVTSSDVLIIKQARPWI